MLTRVRLATAVPIQRWQPLVFVLLAAFCGFLLTQLPLVTAVALVVVTAVALLTLIQPLVGLGLALLAGPFGALESQLVGGSSLDSGQLLLLFTLTIWIGAGLRRRHFVVPHTRLNAPFFILILVLLLTLPGARSMPLGLIETLKWVEMGLIMLLVTDLGRQEIRGRPGLHWIVAMLLLAGVSQALIGLWQFGLRGEGPEHFLVLGRFYRAYGTYEQPNPFAGFVNLSALLALGLLLGLVTHWWQQRRAQVSTAVASRRYLLIMILVAGAALITSMALIFSWSRGAWLGFAAGLAVLLFFWPRRLRWGTVVLTLALLLFVAGYWMDLIPTAVTGRIAGFTADFRFGDVRGVDINDTNYSVLERLAHWQAALSMAEKNLALGVGFGNYGAAYADYALINWPDALGHAHNYYINILAEAGIIGLIAYFGFWIVVVWQTWRVIKQAPWPERGLALGLMAAWTALAVHHLVDKLYVNNIYIHLGVMFGLLQLLDYKTKEGEDRG